MSNEKDNITTIYEKKISDKPFNLDKLQTPLKGEGENIQNTLDKITKLTKNIDNDIVEETKERPIEIDFKKKPKNIE